MKLSKFNIIRYSVVIVIILCVFGIYNLKQMNKYSEKKIDNASYEERINIEELRNKKKPVIINFGLSTCHACKETQESFQSLDDELKTKVIYQFVDIKENENITIDYKVKVVPTQVIYKADGTPYISSNNARIKFTPYYSESDGKLIYSYHEGVLTNEEFELILEDMEVK